MEAYNNNSGLESAGPISFLLGKGIIAQLLLTLTVCTLLQILMLTLEMIQKSFRAVSGTRVDLLPVTVNAENKPREFEQNPNSKKAKLLPQSDNERTGAEFSQSFYLQVNPNSFRQEEGLLHILHKGNPRPFPLMGPGVFLKSNSNTLRVYMNSSKTWNNYVEVENIPVKKWVHVVLVARANALEIYINGNLAKKLNLQEAVFQQNFGNLQLFSQRRDVYRKTAIPSLDSDDLSFFGTFSGQLSNLFYQSYALSQTEIQSLTILGPSSKTEEGSEDAPPYLEDKWWVTNYAR